MIQTKLPDVECSEVMVHGISKLMNDEENDRLMGTSNIKLINNSEPSISWEKFQNFIYGKEINYFRPPILILSIAISLTLFHFCLRNDYQRDLIVWIPVSWSTRPWSLLSYGFIHGDYNHLLWNVITAIIFGWLVECEQRWRVGWVWVLGLLGGSLGGGVFQPECSVVGASAAVFAILTSHIPSVCYLYNKLGPTRQRWAILRIAFVMVTSFCEVYRSLNNNDNIAWSSHLFGAIIGIFAGFAAYKHADKSQAHLLRA